MNILNEVLSLWTLHGLSVDDGLLIVCGSHIVTEGNHRKFATPYEHPKVYVKCHDTFYWAMSDYEPVTTSLDVALLAKTIERLAVYDYDDLDTFNVCTVYAAHRRNLQPMPQYMSGVVQELCKDLPDNKKWA
jgi:hypothetical protein